MRILIEPVTESESFSEGMRAMCGEREVSPEELGPLIMEMLHVSRDVRHLPMDVIVETRPDIRNVDMRLLFYNDYVE